MTNRVALVSGASRGIGRAAGLDRAQRLREGGPHAGERTGLRVGFGLARLVPGAESHRE